MRFHIICQPAVFMRRSVLQQTGLLDPNYHFMLDHHLWLRMARYAPIAYVNNTSSKKRATNDLWAAARHHPDAKNVAQPEAFCEEIVKILNWFQQEPFYKSMLDLDHRRVQGGAYRLKARYLLDGDMPGTALTTYLQAFLLWPQYTAKHWHRILYALVASLGTGTPFKTVRPLTWIDRKRSHKSKAIGDQIAAELDKQIKHFVQKDQNRLEQLDGEVYFSDNEQTRGIWPGLCLME
jgi:hypothetical protein